MLDGPSPRLTCTVCKPQCDTGVNEQKLRWTDPFSLTRNLLVSNWTYLNHSVLNPQLAREQLDLSQSLSPQSATFSCATNLNLNRSLNRGPGDLLVRKYVLTYFIWISDVCLASCWLISNNWFDWLIDWFSRSIYNYSSAFSSVHSSRFTAHVWSCWTFFPTVPYFTAHVLAPLPPFAEPYRPCDRGTSKSQNPDRSQPQHRPQHNTQRSHRKSNIGIKSGGVGYPTFRPRATRSTRVLTQTDLTGCCKSVWPPVFIAHGPQSNQFGSNQFAHCR